MTRLLCNDNVLSVFISKNEKINIDSLKLLMGKGRRMIQQNNATSLVVQLEYTSKVNKDTLAFFNRVLCYSSNFPVIIINS